MMEDKKKILGFQFCPLDELSSIKELVESEKEQIGKYLYCYLYGVMRGKQQERAKRKAGKDGKA